MKNDAMKNVLKGLREQMLKAMVKKQSEGSSKEEPTKVEVEIETEKESEPEFEPKDTFDEMLIDDLKKIEDRKVSNSKGIFKAGIVNETVLPNRNLKKKGK